MDLIKATGAGKARMRDVMMIVTYDEGNWRRGGHRGGRSGFGTRGDEAHRHAERISESSTPQPRTLARD